MNSLFHHTCNLIWTVFQTSFSLLFSPFVFSRERKRKTFLLFFLVWYLKLVIILRVCSFTLFYTPIYINIYRYTHTRDHVLFCELGLIYIIKHRCRIIGRLSRMVVYPILLIHRLITFKVFYFDLFNSLGINLLIWVCSYLSNFIWLLCLNLRHDLCNVIRVLMNLLLYKVVWLNEFFPQLETSFSPMFCVTDYWWRIASSTCRLIIPDIMYRF